MSATIDKDGAKTTDEYIKPTENLNDTLTNIKDKEGEKSVVVPVSKESGSKNVVVSFTAVDYAKNEQYASKSFVIDPVAPEMTLELSSAASRLNGKYYQNDVTVTATITERYLDLANDLSFTINVDGKEETKKFGELAVGNYGITKIETQKVTDESSDSQQTVVALTFGQDHDYIVSAKVLDKAGNEGTATVDEFVVDKTFPVATVTYYAYGSGETFAAATAEEARTYLNADYSSFKAVIAIDELNFSDGSTVNANYTVNAVNSKNAAVSAVDVAKLDSDAKAFGSWNAQKYSIDYADDANYTFDFDYTDLAGNKVQLATNYITLDTVLPTGTVTVSNMVNGDASKTWTNELLSTITFGLFGQNSVSSNMTSDDETAGVASTQYLATSDLMTKSALASATGWTDYQTALSLAANENVIVYEKIVDKAGNVAFYSSENVVVDNVNPAPVVTITPSAPAWNKGVYAATDNPGFDIVVTDPITNNAYSGLQEITYRIVNGTTGTEETGTLASFTKGSHEQRWSGHVAIDPAKFYSNDVQITVTASDFSTNGITSETQTLKVDNEAPVVSFSFDTSDALNGKYYNKVKELTITVNERNFDPSYEPTVTSTMGGGYSFSGWTTNGEVTTGVVSFTGDSDFTVTYDCYDLAGNKSNTENLQEITIDLTNPVITVSYDNNAAQNGNYYRSGRTATITIVEHNFNAAEVQTAITAMLNGQGIDTPVVSGFADSGDTHTATVSYPGDGDYTFTISYSDLAGNAAGSYAGDSFTVDLTNPEVVIEGVQDKSANSGNVAPVIRMSDINFDSDNVTFTLTGVNSGEVETAFVRTVDEQGTTITFQNFPDGMDDIYTLTAKSVDKAGNETTRSITFSVNRDGSTYVINETTQNLLSYGYTNSPKDIVITEVNVDSLQFVSISYTKDGQVVELVEGKDYKVEEETVNGGWKQYTYTIFASVFEEEGDYSINIYSEDGANNNSTNKTKGFDVNFVVDKTAPTIAVANLDETVYPETAHEFSVAVKDNAVLDHVDLIIDGVVVKTYTKEELDQTNGMITYSINEKNEYQTIELKAYDAAGNEGVSEQYSVLVTSSGWVRFINNKGAVGGSIAGLVAVAGGAGWFIFGKKRKKDKDEK
ncbi:MAG: Ig-like domain repeat protein [Firmicutes bacterium]|nr:Ig-like domain repeat protein [Bacillota bacterium]